MTRRTSAEKRNSSATIGENAQMKTMETTTTQQQQQQQQKQQKRGKFSSNLFNFYRKNVAPKLGDFGSFARDMMNDKPPVVTNENEEREVDYDDIRSSGENVRGSW